MAEAIASINIELESTTELRNKLLSSTAGRFSGQHGVGAHHIPLKRLRPAAPPARFVSIIYCKGRPGRPRTGAPRLCSCWG